MIDVIKQTPSEYSKQSRDYQVLARLYTALYNLSKMYTDNMSVWSLNIDNKLSVLRSKTLNFDPKHDWDLDELDSAISCFKYIMRSKGTITALKFCLTILLRTKNIEADLNDASIEVTEDGILLVKIPKQLASAGIVEDLFEYLLPAGMLYRIIEYSSYDTGDNTTKLYYNYNATEVEHEGIKDWDMGIYNFFDSSEADNSSEITDSSNRATNWYKNTIITNYNSSEQNEMESQWEEDRGLSHR